MDYKEKLKLAKEALESGSYDRETIEYIFPELKESKEEKLRKEIIKHLISFNNGCYKRPSEDIIDNWIAWLEKQSEQKPINYTDEEIVEAVKDTSVLDLVEPKFKVGDCITNGQLTCKVWGITDKSYELHLHNDDYCHFETDRQRVNKDYHLWTIQDAKDGDILHSTGWHNDCIFIFNGLDSWKFDEPNGDRAVATGYCCLFVSADKMEFGIQGPDCIEVNTVKPATKEQHDLLFKRMKEAGYEWDADKKKLGKLVIDEGKSEMDYCFTKMMNGEKVSSAWSEEDEENSYHLKTLLENLAKDNKYEFRVISDNDRDKYTAWLKSLKDRYTWKPSEEQIETLWDAIVYVESCNSNFKGSGHVLELIYNDLKKLRNE